MLDINAKLFCLCNFKWFSTKQPHLSSFRDSEPARYEIPSFTTKFPQLGVLTTRMISVDAPTDTYISGTVWKMVTTMWQRNGSRWHTQRAHSIFTIGRKWGIHDQFIDSHRTQLLNVSECIPMRIYITTKRVRKSSCLLITLMPSCNHRERHCRPLTTRSFWTLDQWIMRPSIGSIIVWTMRLVAYSGQSHMLPTIWLMK